MVSKYSMATKINNKKKGDVSPMKKWLTSFAVVAVIVGILVVVLVVFGNENMIKQIWNSANGWIGGLFNAGSGIQIN